MRRVIFVVCAALLLSGCGVPVAPDASRAAVPTFGVPTFDASKTVSVPTNAPGQLSSSEQNYLRDVNRQLETVNNALDLVARAARLAAADPSLLLDRDWRDATAIGLAALKAAALELRAADAPPRFADAQRDLDYAATDLIGMVDELARGMDTVRASHITLALTRQRVANDALSRARQRLAIAAASDFTPAPTDTPRPALLNLTPARVDTRQP